MSIQILPSLLAADFGALRAEILRVQDSGADALHLDIMDAHFVPNLSFGPDVAALARRTVPAIALNVHLMMTRPDLYAVRFADAGANTVQIHVEADCDVWSALQAIRARGIRSGLVLRPQTPVETIYPYVQLCDEVLFMTVNPGYGGQAFMPEVMPKVAALRRRVRAEGRSNFDIMVDGGINFETARVAAAAGANQFVAGSFLFKQADMAAAIQTMRTQCESVWCSEVL